MAEIAALEAQAAEYERRLAALEQLALQKPNTDSLPADPPGPLQEFKAQLLQLREALVQAQEEVTAIASERDEALKRVSRLEYQCEHLKRSLKDQDAQ